MPRLLFVKSRRASFIELDQSLLAERYDVHELYQPGRFRNPLSVLRDVLAADVVGGPQAWLSRFTMRRARIVMTNSEYSRQEIWRNIGIPPTRVRLVYHGVP